LIANGGGGLPMCDTMNYSCLQVSTLKATIDFEEAVVRFLVDVVGGIGAGFIVAVFSRWRYEVGGGYVLGTCI
jgi:hypothetical protein